MIPTTHFPPGRLTDGELLARVQRLARHEQDATALLVAHLAELDERRLHITLGYSSLFTYCVGELGLSEDAAFARIRAARAGRRFPLVLERLLSRSVTLTAVRLLGPHLTPSNHRDLLDRTQGLGLHEVKKLVAEISPRPDVPSSVRRLPGAVGVAPPDLQSDFADAENAAVEAIGGGAFAISTPRCAPAPLPRPAIVEPLAPRRYKIQFTASEEMHQRLEAARALLRHQIPDGDVAAILDAGLVALLEKTEKRKFSRTDRPRAARQLDAATLGSQGESAPGAVVSGADDRAGCVATEPSRCIPAQVRRDIWSRDGGQCGYRSPTGRRCEERGAPEFHHLEPFAVGGGATADNISLRCRAHNRLEAEIAMGSRVIVRALAARARPPGG